MTIDISNPVVTMLINTKKEFKEKEVHINKKPNSFIANSEFQDGN